MNEPIVEVYRVQKGSRPELSREAGAVKECSNFDRERVVVDLSTAVLQGTVHAGGFDNIPGITEHHIVE
jgi:hypothetical protein